MGREAGVVDERLENGILPVAVVQQGQRVGKDGLQLVGRSDMFQHFGAFSSRKTAVQCCPQQLLYDEARNHVLVFGLVQSIQHRLLSPCLPCAHSVVGQVVVSVGCRRFLRRRRVLREYKRRSRRGRRSRSQGRACWLDGLLVLQRLRILLRSVRGLGRRASGRRGL